MILSLIIGILTLVAEWMIFKKMGRQGWEGIVPIYNTYVLCQELYGNGWKFLLLLIPIYNIYFVIKMNIDWAKAFNQGVGFGIGLLLLPFIFQLILAFGGDQYGMAAIPIPSPTWWRMWSARPRMPFPATRTTTRSSKQHLKKQLAIRVGSPAAFLYYFFNNRLIKPKSMSISPSSSRRIPSSAFCISSGFCSEVSKNCCGVISK